MHHVRLDGFVELSKGTVVSNEKMRIRAETLVNASQLHSDVSSANNSNLSEKKGSEK